MQLRVIIADDHEMVREGLEVIIGKIADVEIVGTASNGEDLLRLTRSLLPDVVLTDVKRPKMDGIQATRILKQEFPHIGVIALSSYDEERLMTDILKAGAKGYLLKNASRTELAEAIKAVYKDEPYYCRLTRAKLGQIVTRGGQLLQENKADLFTARELEVIHYVCEGLSSKQIADRLHLKTRSVERYRDSIMSKMEVNNAAGVVMYAVTHGLYKPVTEKK